MKIIIVGAAGAVGKTAVDALAGRHEVIRVGRTSGDVHMDIEDIDSIRSICRIYRVNPILVWLLRAGGRCNHGYHGRLTVRPVSCPG